jgi:hypothetical protein
VEKMKEISAAERAYYLGPADPETAVCQLGSKPNGFFPTLREPMPGPVKDNPLSEPRSGVWGSGHKTRSTRNTRQPPSNDLFVDKVFGLK